MRKIFHRPKVSLLRLTSSSKICFFTFTLCSFLRIDFSSQEFFKHSQIHMVFCRHFVFYSVQVSLNICTLKQNLKTEHSNVQWNVFKGVYFYWEKSTPQFECAMECLQRSVFLLEKKYSPIQNRTDLKGVLFSMWE